MKTLVLLIFLMNFFASYGTSRDYEFTSYDYFKQQDGSQCKQEVPNCSKCLQKRSCKWCTDSQSLSGVCKSTNDCPSTLFCPENDLEDQVRNILKDRSLILDVKQVTFNASYLCHLKTNCSTCVVSNFCAWCDKKKKCIAYSGVSTKESCGSDSWYKNQCIYSGFTKPCPSRKPTCKECLHDGVCYWCESTKKCDYYQGDGFKPANCSTDQWYYKSCSHMREILVLLPIILFILTPVIVYIILYCILCVMRNKGYEGLEDSDSSDDEDKKRRPIMLRHGSPGGKTDKLRKKYDLDRK